MGRRTRIAAFALCAGLTAGHSAAGQTPSAPTVYALIMDAAGVPADTLARAQDDATRVFQLSGITLVWVDAKTCTALCLTIRIVARPVSAKSRDPHMLGVAASTPEARGINVWIFYPRIRAYSVDLGMHISQLLGHVIAHEMGHLLLPYDTHSAAGVMRPAWDDAQVRAAVKGGLTFTPDQAASIREHLSACASPTRCAR